MVEFKKLIETRFADPVMALDISKRFVGYGSAMGRTAFYSIEFDKETSLAESQPELIRGIDHSEDGDSIYISIGDISCQKLTADELELEDYVQIVEDFDEKAHKNQCERQLTLLH